MADGEVSFSITPATDSQLARLETFVDGDSVSWVDLDGPGLDWLITNLGAARAALADPVPAELDTEAPPQIVDDPAWWIFDAEPEGQTLAVRHPGLGWLSFFFPQAQASEIAGWLGKPFQR